MRRLIEVLGEEEAETLMESLPPVVWHQIATKDDLAALEERLRAEMNTGFAEFKSEFCGELAGLRGEFAEFKSEFKSELAGLKGEFAEFKSELAGLKGEFADQRGELTGLKVELADQRGEWKTELARNTRTTVLSFVGVAVAMLGAMVGTMVALAQAGALAA